MYLSSTLKWHLVAFRTTKDPESRLWMKPIYSLLFLWDSIKTVVFTNAPSAAWVCQHIYQTTLPVMQVCPDRNSVNEPEAADDDISVFLSQMMSGSVKSRALAREASWAFSHVASKQKAFSVIFLIIYVHSSQLAVTVIVNMQVYNLLCLILKFSRQRNCSFFVAFLICTYQGHLLKMQRDLKYCNFHIMSLFLQPVSKKAL